MAKKKKKKKLKKEKLLAVKTSVSTPDAKDSTGKTYPVQVLGPEFPVQKVQYIVSRLNHIESYKDVSHTFHLLDELKKEVSPFLDAKGFALEVSDKAFGMIGVTDIFGYRPQGTTFWNLFPNPFGIFGYLAENHCAVLDARNCYWKEILNDGYRLVGNKANFDKAREVCKFLKMKTFRARLADHAKVYGNWWLNPIKNGVGGIAKLEPLLPSYIRPIPSQDGQRIMGWEYQMGYVVIRFREDELLHGKYRPSHRHYDIGNPPLGSCLVDIEADIQASMYNNLVFQKGGLLGMAVLLEKGPNAGIGGSLSTFAKNLQSELNANASGARSGFQTVVFENTKDVKILNDLASLDGAFHKTSDKVTKMIAHAMGIPHELMGVVTNANQQYHAARMTDYNAAQFDKSINELTDCIDTWINEEVFPLFGLTDVGIQAKKRYNSLARTATQSGLDLGGLYKVMSVNEYRVEVLKRPPVPWGNIPLTRIPTTQPEGSKPLIPPPTLPAVEWDEEEDEYTNDSEFDSLEQEEE